MAGKKSTKRLKKAKKLGSTKALAVSNKFIKEF